MHEFWLYLSFWIVYAPAVLLLGSGHYAVGTILLMWSLPALGAPWLAIIPWLVFCWIHMELVIMLLFPNASTDKPEVDNSQYY
ncbi:MAG: hypothetical protein ACSHWQ_06895 [Spongiibacteraceae bacterium]